MAEELWYIKIEKPLIVGLESEIIFSETRKIAIRKDVAKNPVLMSSPERLRLLSIQYEIDSVRQEMSKPENIVRKINLKGAPSPSLGPLINTLALLDREKRRIWQLEKSAIEVFDSLKSRH